MNFDEELEIKINDINKHLEEYLKISKNEKIREAMSYSLFAGGKRLRPLLLLGALQSVSSEYESGIPFACALEMIHTYSLIHDDLPAMDDDDLRRGKPTNHKKFGEAIAILAGDGLLNLAFEIMIDSGLYSDSNNRLLAMKEISNASGVNGMIGGQVMDIIFENKHINNNSLLNIHRNKTGAIFRASVVAGAILGNADAKTIQLFTDIGEKMGLAFQIKDDILDVYGNEEQLGKPVGSDEKNCKRTYVTLHGIEKAKEDYNSISKEVLSLLEFVDDSFLFKLTKKIIDRAQ